jgi:ferritin
MLKMMGHVLTMSQEIQNQKQYTMKAAIENALNNQILKDASSSQFYLAMASWAEANGLGGTARFMYTHSDEERMHMLKLVKFINERGGKAIIPAIALPPKEFNGLENVFELLLQHEIMVTESINNLVDICLQEKDYTTHNFVQWYVSEQLEEEALARSVLDKLRLIGGDKGGMYMFDRDLENAAIMSDASNSATQK